MATKTDTKHDLVTNSAKILSVLSRRDNLNIFTFAHGEGLAAKSSTIKKLGLSRKVYYIRLKQLMNAGLIEKLDCAYKHTTLGKIIYQNHILCLMEYLKYAKQMKMIDTLMHTKQFSEGEVANFVSKITGDNINTIAGTNASSPKTEFVSTYHEMVSAIVRRVEFCKNEILLANRFLDETILNSLARKADSSKINVKVLTDLSIITQYFKIEGEDLRLQNDVDNKNSTERINMVSSPWYLGKVDRRIFKIPFSIIILDGREVGLEIVNWNDPRNFYGIIFVKGDQATLKAMQDHYYQLWDSAYPLYDYNEKIESQKASIGYLIKQFNSIQEHI
jgi:hypothetical protein